VALVVEKNIFFDPAEISFFSSDAIVFDAYRVTHLIK